MNFAQLISALVRAVLYSVTTLAVVVALILSLGRVSANFVAGFSVEINETLSPLNVEVSDITASWRGVNPVFGVARLTFNSGYVEELEVEVDLLQSLLAGAWVPKLLYWQQLRVYVDQSAQGWQLRNQGDVSLPFDLEKIIAHGGRIIGDVEVVLTPVAASAQTYIFLIDLVNDSDTQFAYVRAALQDSEDPPLTIGYLRENSEFSAGMLAEQYFAGGSLAVPTGMVADSSLLVSLSNGYLSIIDGVNTTGHTNVRVVASQSAGLTDMLGADFTLSLKSLDNHFVGALSEISLFNASQAINLADFLVRLDFGSDELFKGSELMPNVRAWSAGLDVGQVSRMVQDSAEPSSVLWEWFSALGATGDVKDLHLFSNSEISLGYAADVENIRFQGYRGVPTLDNGGGEVWGDTGHVGFAVRGQDMTMLFPDLFSQAWLLDEAQGMLSLIIRPGYLALRGEDITAKRGDSTIFGEFATTRPLAKYEQRVAVQVNVDTAELADAQSYVPYKLSSGLYNWLKTAPKQGRFDNVELALQGQIHRQPKRKFDRRFELAGDFSSVEMRYLPEWPVISEAHGRLKVMGQETAVEVVKGQSLGVAFTQATAFVNPDGIISLDFVAAPTAAAALYFIRFSPLQDSLSFVEDDWRTMGDGIIDLTAHLEVPLARDSADTTNKQSGTAAPVEFNLAKSGIVANLSMQISAVSIDMPSYKLAINDITGPANFSLPHHFHGQLKASMFGRPALIQSDSDAQWLNIGIDGYIDADEALNLMSVDAPSILRGETEFSSQLNLSMGGNISNLVVNTDLVGMQVNLPAEFGKTSDAAEASEFVITFLPAVQQVGWQYKSTNGWLRLPSGSQEISSGNELLGRVGISALPQGFNQTLEGFEVSGQMPLLDVDDWVSDDGEATFDLPFDWRINQLNIDELVVGEFAFQDVQLGGRRQAEELVFDLSAEDIIGRIDLTDRQVLGVDLSYLHLPVVSPLDEDQDSTVDPMSIELGKVLPRAQVKVGSLHLGGESFGAWVFDIKPESTGVRFDIEAVDVKGVHIRDSVAFWDLEKGRTSFSGTAVFDDLFTTLPQWGYVPVVETEFARVAGNISWPGSPANLDVLHGEGGITILAKNGRFLDVEAEGGLRLVSLLNISALAKRINLDFSDVVDEGISFSRVGADIQLEDQQLSFNKNLLVNSTSSTYELGGTVDLREGTLKNEMIVTLPVSESLPWYAAYVAIANPLAGIGVAIGERILRKPIQRMSSAKFTVDGRIDDPEVKFLTLWGESIDAMPDAGERLSPDLLDPRKSAKDETQ